MRGSTEGPPSGDHFDVPIVSLLFSALTFLLRMLLCQPLLFSASSIEGCSLTSELEWKWSRILATTCMYVVVIITLYSVIYE